MAGVTLDGLPPAIGLNGGELLWIYQQGPTEVTPWIGLRCTTAQLAAYILNYQTTTTMRQLLTALGSLQLLVQVFDALSSDITDSFNIAWNHANQIGLADPFITGFLQPTLGYTNDQIEALFAFANTTTVASGAPVTIRQLAAAMAAEGTLVSVLQSLTSDITNAYNIAWNHAYSMPLNDIFITGFLQPTLGYTDNQMKALYVYAATFPA